jgi:hypothetical protein
MRYTNKQRQELYNYFFKYVQDLFYFESDAVYISQDRQAKKDKERRIKNGVDGLTFHGFKSTPIGYILKISSEKNSFTFSIHDNSLKEEDRMFSLFGRFEYVNAFSEANKKNLIYSNVNMYSGKCNFHDSFSSDSMSDAKRKIRAYVSAILGGL